MVSSTIAKDAILRILIVNAEPHITTTLYALLQVPGVTLATALDSQNGLEMLQRSSQPVVVIVDLRLRDWPTSQAFLTRLAADPPLATQHAVILLLSTVETIPVGMSSIMQSLHLFFAAKPLNQGAIRATVHMAATVIQQQDVSTQPTHRVAPSGHPTFLPSAR